MLACGSPCCRACRAGCHVRQSQGAWGSGRHPAQGSQSSRLAGGKPGEQPKGASLLNSLSQLAYCNLAPQSLQPADPVMHAAPNGLGAPSARGTGMRSHPGPRPSRFAADADGGVPAPQFDAAVTPLHLPPFPEPVQARPTQLQRLEPQQQTEPVRSLPGVRGGGGGGGRPGCGLQGSLV